MIKEMLYNTNTSPFIGALATPKDCTCLGCSICFQCILFPPIVGLFLAPSLGVDLVQTRAN